MSCDTGTKVFQEAEEKEVPPHAKLFPSEWFWMKTGSGVRNCSVSLVVWGGRSHSGGLKPRLLKTQTWVPLPRH